MLYTRAPRDAGQIPSRPVLSRPGTGWDDKIKVIAGRDGIVCGMNGMGRDGTQLIHFCIPSSIYVTGEIKIQENLKYQQQNFKFP
jgi:hypothetical protein